MVTPSPLPGGGRSLHIDPCGKAIDPMRKPLLLTPLWAEVTAGVFTMGAVSSGKTSTPIYPFAEQIIGRNLYRTKGGIIH